VDETLRWPTNLDRAGIERRLIQVRDAARAQGLAEIVRFFEDPHAQSAAHLGANVLAALEWLQDKPQHRPITMQLEMVAMNLKNLK
jgi:hypothetical protein